MKGLSGFGDAIDLLCRSLIFVSTVYLKTNKKKRHVFIAGDPVSLAAVYLLQRRTNNVLIYWSLELWIEKDLQNFGQILVKKIERYCNKFSLYTIEFGQSRCNLLSVENKIPLSSMLSIPNSPLGAAEIKRNYYFNEMFNIEKDKKIVLHAGGYGEAYCINSLINQIAAWPSDCVLVIHTKAEMKLSNNDMLYQLLKRRKNVFLSNEPVPFERLDDIYSSCDIGLVFFDGTHTAMNTNLSCPDLSSGKMFHYLKFGVPIITQKLMGFEELIEGNEVGICIDKFDDITESITKILSHENGYKQNCIKMFRKYIFKEYHDKIVRLIEEAI
ncbi:MAG: hypothetical protein NTV58_17820 [Deltaproteobacteria bacterium]|nr:hypothetical protein [Deltaproteobacteria bacterium]